MWLLDFILGHNLNHNETQSILFLISTNFLNQKLNVEVNNVFLKKFAEMKKNTKCKHVQEGSLQGNVPYTLPLLDSFFRLTSFNFNTANLGCINNIIFTCESKVYHNNDKYYLLHAKTFYHLTTF